MNDFLPIIKNIHKQFNAFLWTSGPKIIDIHENGKKGHSKKETINFLSLFKPVPIAKLKSNEHHGYGPKWCMPYQKTSVVHIFIMNDYGKESRRGKAS
jgi:hypothetical protein